MITCSRHSDIEKETRKQEKMAPLVISPPLSFHYSGGFRGGDQGPRRGGGGGGGGGGGPPPPPPPAPYF